MPTLTEATFIFDGETFFLSLADAENRAYSLALQGYEFIISRSVHRTIFEIYSL